MKNNKRILISAPIGGKKQYSLRLWFEWIVKQDYEDVDVCLCTNGDERLNLNEKIMETKLIHKSGKKIKVIPLTLEDSNKLTVIQKITYSRETIRRFAISQGYKHLFFLDTDTIPLQSNAIKLLLAPNIPVLSGIYFYKNSKVPVVIDDRTKTNLSLELLENLYNNNDLYRVWGFGYGCLMLSNESLKVPFDYSLFGEERTDDFGHCEALERSGFNRFINPKVICKHFSSNNKFEKINDYLSFERKN